MASTGSRKHTIAITLDLVFVLLPPHSMVETIGISIPMANSGISYSPSIVPKHRLKASSPTP